MDMLAVDSTSNDLEIDANGNLKVLTGGEALALAAACAVRTFKGEPFYDAAQGLPYMTDILAKNPPLEYVRSQIAAAALGADPDIVESAVYFTSFTSRNLSGQIQVSDSTGKIAASQF